MARRARLANRDPAAWPGRPCAPLLTSARTSPARSAPDWAHRFGSPVLPIELQAWVTALTSAESQELADSGTFRKKQEAIC